MSNAQDNQNTNRSKTSTGPWIALFTAVGVTATAIVIAKQMRKKSVRAHVEDLFSLCSTCDNALKTLDERLVSCATS